MFHRRKDIVPIWEHLERYTPPFDVKPYVRKALRLVPEHDLAGLHHILLTSTLDMNREERRSRTRRRGRTMTLSEAAGVYHHRWHGNPAHIALYMDQILADITELPPRGYGRYRVGRRVARTLYHEIGHHVHRTKRPEHREPENVADEYMQELANWYALRYASLPFVLLLVTLPFRPWLWPRFFRTVRALVSDIRAGLNS